MKWRKGEIQQDMKWRRLKNVYVWGVLLLIASMSVQMSFAQGPDTVILDDMARYYEPVEFAHEMHVDLLGSKSCAICHHHTVGTQLIDENCLRCHVGSTETDSAACRDCHPVKRFSADYLAAVEKDIHLYHVDKPGLKGAFHQRCLGCHRTMDAAGDCRACHARTDAGDKFFYSGKYAPDSETASSGDHK